jgi:hypothetical protein
MATLAFQAFPSIIGKRTAERGGNAMGLTANDKHRFILEITFLWRDGKEDSIVHGMARQLTASLDKKLVQIKANAAGSSAETYLPFFMNDASADQDVFGSYKDAVKFKQLYTFNDPKGFWKRGGGFQFS